MRSMLPGATTPTEQLAAASAEVLLPANAQLFTNSMRTLST
jgi:hypothetical protein